MRGAAEGESPVGASWRWNGEGFVVSGSVPLSDRGFRYGMSVFESLRVSDGRAEFFEAHAVRLRAACGQVGFPFPEDAMDKVEGVLEGFSGLGFARIYVTAGPGDPTAPVKDSGVWVFVEERANPLAVGLRVRLAPESAPVLFGGLKTGNYWRNLEELRCAREAGYGESVLRNERGEVVSACVANLFVVRGGRIETPALGGGARAGVVREWVLEQERVEQGVLRREDLEEADEMFLTNSWMGVREVAVFSGRELPSRRVSMGLREKWEARRREGRSR